MTKRGRGMLNNFGMASKALPPPPVSYSRASAAGVGESSLVLEAKGDWRHLSGDRTARRIDVARLHEELPRRVLDADCQTDASIGAERTSPCSHTDGVNIHVAAGVSIVEPDRLAHGICRHERAL